MFTALFIIYIFSMGLVFGSFFNVVGLRVPKQESIVHPPSHCTHCNTRLKMRDLVPVLSYILTGGKCRYCGQRLSPLYPVGELLTGLLYVWSYLHFGLSWEWLVSLLVISLSIIITISDLRYMLIPNKVLLFFAPLLVIVRILYHPEPLWNYLLGAVVGGGVLLLIAIVSRGGMGMGDVKLLFVFGWVLGFPYVLLALVLASLIGAIVGGILIITKIVKRKQPIPFGPYLALGTFVTLMYGQTLIEWYFSLIP